MARTKKITTELINGEEVTTEEEVINEEVINEKPYIDVRKKVMDRETLQVKIIDSTVETDRKTKYLHCSGIEFND